MLPILLSIPHGGSRTPDELIDRVCLTPEDLFDDGDACTIDIYDLEGDVARVVKTDIARAFVDMNRAPDDRPPQNPDGVVKTATCLQRPIYKPGFQPDGELIEELIRQYHAPYHSRLEQFSSDIGVELALDCHSMLSTAPPIGANRGERRPLFCLSNRDGATAPSSLLGELSDAIASAFEITSDQIGLNDPFRGGYVTRRHGGGRVSWIQVEMNRSLYLAEPWFDRENLKVDAQRLAELQTRFRTALHLLNL